MNAAVCDRAGTVHFLEGVMGRGEIDGIEEFMPDSFKAFWHKNVTQVDSPKALAMLSPISYPVPWVSP